MDYEHTQRAPLYLLLHAIGIATVVGAWQIEDPEVSTPIAIFSGFFFLLGLSFRQLSCRDEGDYLRISFGPLALFRTGEGRGEPQQLEGWLGNPPVLPRRLGLEYLGLRLRRHRLRRGEKTPPGDR